MSKYYGELPFLGMQRKYKIKGTIIRFYFTVQIFQVAILSFCYLFLIFVKTDTQIKDQVIVSTFCRLTAFYNTESFNFAVVAVLNDVVLGLVDKLLPSKYFTKLRNHKEIINISIREQALPNLADQ